MKFFANDGSIVKEPFKKFEVSVRLGRNHFYHVWMPIMDGVPLVENDENILVPQDHTFRVVKSKKSGRFLIVPDRAKTLDILAVITGTAGFRGSTGLIEDDTTAQILLISSTHAACTGNVTVAALIRLGEQVVTYSRGRRNNDIIVWRNESGNLNKTIYTKSEYSLIATSVNEDDYEEI